MIERRRVLQSAELRGNAARLAVKEQEVNVMKQYDAFYDDNLEDVENEYLTPKEVMNLLYIGRNTFYKLVNSGELPAFRIGKQWRIRKDDLREYFQRK